jgi:hypothetical protein
MSHLPRRHAVAGLGGTAVVRPGATHIGEEIVRAVDHVHLTLIALQQYNLVVGSHGMTPLPLSAAPNFGRFVDWAQRSRVHVGLWIWAKHAAAKWKSRLRIGALVGNDAFLERFRDWGERQASRDYFDAVDSSRVIDGTRPDGDDLSPLGETMKSRLADDRDSCLFNIRFTGGWNPSSAHCASCSRTADCKASMSPEVVIRRERLYEGP